MVKIELHILQNFPVSNLNAGENGKPKSMDGYGGFPRVRVSSQAWKYAMRKAFTFEVGKRTRFLPRAILEKLEENGKKKEDIIDIIKSVLAFIFLPRKDRTKKKIEDMFDDEKLKLKTVIYVNKDLPENIAKVILNNLPIFNSGKNEEKEAILNPIFEDIKNNINADIALFGRMFASQPSLNVDGAVSMAHSFSVNDLDAQKEFFITSDDLKKKTERGAAHMGRGDNVQWFSNPCLYRVGTLNYDLLLSNNQGKEDYTNDVLKDYIDVYIKSIPQGKHNSMYASNPPDFILIGITEGQTNSLANAFENPIKVTRENQVSVLNQAIERIDSYIKDLGRFFGFPEKLFFATIGDRKTPFLDENAAKCKNINELIDNVIASIKEMR